MLAKNNEYLEETAESLFKANADEIVRQQCLAREDAERRERTLERDNKKLKEDLEAANGSLLAAQERELQGIYGMVDLCKELGMDLEATLNKIAGKVGVTPNEIRERLEKYWKGTNNE